MKAVAGKSNSFKHRKPFDEEISYCDKPTTSILQIEIDEQSTFVYTPKLKTAFDPNHQKLLSVLFKVIFKFIIHNFLVMIFRILNLQVPNQTLHNFCHLKEKLLLLVSDQNRFSHRLRLVQGQHQVRSLQYCVMTRHQSSVSENLPSLLCDNTQSIKPSSGIETSFAFHSYPNASLIVGYQELNLSLNAINNADIPHHSLDENSRPPTPNPYHYPLILDIAIINFPKQNQRCHVLPVNRLNNILQDYTFIRN